MAPRIVHDKKPVSLPDSYEGKITADVYINRNRERFSAPFEGSFIDSKLSVDDKFTSLLEERLGKEYKQLPPPSSDIPVRQFASQDNSTYALVKYTVDLEGLNERKN